MMNQNVPHWNLEDDSTRLATPRKPNWLEEGGELVELLRQDGYLLTQSQNHHLKLSSAISGELKPVEEHRQCEQSLACSAILIGDDENESLFQYPLGDPLLEKDFTSEFFSEMAGIDVIGSVVGTPSASHQSTLHPREKTKPPPPPPQLKSSYFPMSSFGSHGAKLREKGCGSGSTVGGSSIPTIGSSICGSNQIHVAGERKEDSSIWLPSESKRKNSNEATSDCSFRIAGVQGEINQDQKRKRKDMHDLEYQSEQAEYEPTEEKKPSQRSTSTHRSRAAEVHNLSERRRRDRINEKMKALQDLIPHCNKADKASMLEEAIEYLKSLQLQVQMMWMGRGMAQVMFPGGQQFMSGTSPLMHHAVTIPSFVGSSSSTNQTQLCPSQALNAVNFQSQRPSFHLQGSYAPYFGFHHLQPHPQAFMNPSTPLSNSVQQNRPTAAPGSSILPCSAGAPFENGNSKSG